MPKQPHRRWNRWVLVATAADPNSEASMKLASAWNEDPQRFMFRLSALGAKKFYERRLRLPVVFWVRRTGEMDV
jgi:hypothetical protein